MGQVCRARKRSCVKTLQEEVKKNKKNKQKKNTESISFTYQKYIFRREQFIS